MKDEIKSKIDITDLISETVQLSRRGNGYWGLCPFHWERTPSFSVRQDKQFAHCFGCGWHGDSIQFVVDYYHLDFRGAVNWLAERNGVSRPSLTPQYRTAVLESMAIGKKEASKEDAIKSMIECEYKRLLDLRDRFEMLRSTVKAYGNDPLLAFERPYVYVAFENWDRLNYWLDEFNKGTDEDILELVTMTRRWNPWDVI